MKTPYSSLLIPYSFVVALGACADVRDPCADFGACTESNTSTESSGLPPVTTGDLTTGEPPIERCADVLALETNAGCRFWAVDLPASWHPSSPYSLDIAQFQRFAVVVSNVSETKLATVRAYRGDSTEHFATVRIGPGNVAPIELTKRNIDPTTSSGTEAFRIESDVPITAYQFQPLDNTVQTYSNDASALLPEHVLGDDYIAVTSDGVMLTMYPDGFDKVAFPAGAFISVVATADKTRVTLTPPAGVAIVGAHENIQVHRGDVYTFISDPNVGGGNLSGSRIRADSPVAVFAGNISAPEPADGGCCADHLEHQMLPLVAWGTRYAVAPPPDPYEAGASDPAVYRITGSHNGTELVYDPKRPGGAPMTIDAHQTAVFQSSAAFTVSAVDPNRPFAVTQFVLSGEAANPGREEEYGDPAMLVLPAVDQNLQRHRFLVPDGYVTNVATIVGTAGTKVEVDGERIELGNTVGALEGEGYGFVHVPVNEGAHEVVASEPVGLRVVGYDSWVSYAYPGGTAIMSISDLPPEP